MAGMAADPGSWPSRSSRIVNALGVVAEIGSGMATVRDFGRVSDCLLPDAVRGIRLEIGFQVVGGNDQGRAATNSMLGASDCWRRTLGWRDSGVCTTLGLVRPIPAEAG
jgi:hypothetical protein